MSHSEPILPKQSTVKPQTEKSLTIAGKSVWGKNRALRVRVTFCKLRTQVNVFKAFSFPTGGTSIA